MDEKIQAYAKKLKLSWIRKHYHEIEANDNKEFLEKLFEKEIEHREKRKIELLFKEAKLPSIPNRPFDWQSVQLSQGLDKQSLLDGTFINNREKAIFYSDTDTNKTFLATLIGVNAIQKDKKRVKYYTIASLVNELLDAYENGTLDKAFKQIDKLDLLILDELGDIPLHRKGAELLCYAISICYEKRSILILTNLPFSEWGYVFGDTILTENIMNQFMHHSHLVVFNENSYQESSCQVERTEVLN